MGPVLRSNHLLADFDSLEAAAVNITTLERLCSSATVSVFSIQSSISSSSVPPNDGICELRNFTALPVAAENLS
ncbi:unnamed protein product [Lasius platythorax]|uniref:Uncharacterized protein n=1 Tax=Lasius platythorax TaxID=488582 RepID=A0AAV2MYU5_9HYME